MAPMRQPPKQEKYGLIWEPLMIAPAIEMQMVRQGGKIKGAGNGLLFHFKALISLLWPEHVWHQWNEMELESYLKFRIIGEMGPASCVAGHTRIPNPISGESPTIKELCEAGIRPVVMTLRGPVLARVPFVKGVADLYEVRLENGQVFTATGHHLVLAESGFVPVSILSSGVSRICGYSESLPASILELGQSAQLSNDPSFSRIVEGCSVDCLNDSHSYGEPPRPAVSNASAFSLSPADAQAHSPWCGLADVRDEEPERIHPHLLFDRLSTQDIDHLFGLSEILGFHLGHEGTPSHDAYLSQRVEQFQIENASLRSDEGLFRNFCSIDPTVGQLNSCREYRGQHVLVESVKLVGRDAFYDLQVPGPNHYFAEGAIHHNSGKTHSAAINVLTDYYVWPECTTVLVSSTEREMLEMRVWGEIKKYHAMAQRRYPHLVPGNLIESRQRIVTDSHFEAAEGRDFRNGICGVPCKKGGSYVGLGSFAGIKNKRLRMVADECHLMNRVFVDSISNLNKNPDFKCVALGNPKDTTDALGVVCEPAAHLGGWDGGIDQTDGAKTWPTRFENGICIQLDGEASPNLDDKLGIPLITQSAIDADIAFYGKDSLQFTMMNKGRMPRGQGLRRVITRQMCLKFGAMEEPIWKNENRTKLAGLDAAYGSVGGDRCVLTRMEFGPDPNDRQILALIETMLVPVSVEVNELPEDQIATFVKEKCEGWGVPPQNFGFDSTGRGTLVGAFGRIWSPHVVPIEFGGKPSERQVTWIPNTTKMTCREYYSKFVSELWYSVALTIQSRQFRGMTEEVMNEGAMREWGIVGANKIEVEPKEKMKLKTGRSPDLFDSLVSAVEMARRLGFHITMIMAKNALQIDDGWKKTLQDRMRRLESNHRLTYS